MPQSSSVLLLKCSSLLARVGVARFGLVKAKLPLTCSSLLDLPERLSELAAILHVVSSDLYKHEKQGGKLSLQPVVACIAAPAALWLLDLRLKPQYGASQSSVDASHR